MLDQTIIIYFLLFILAIISVYFYQTVRSWKDLPPGPWGFPIVGHLPLLGDNSAVTFMQMAKQYGDVFYIRLGGWHTVVLNSRQSIREALIGQSEVFSDRPPFYSSKAVNDMRSLGFGSYTPRWRLHKKIAIGVLRNFASSKKDIIQEIIQTDADKLVEQFIARQGIPFDPHALIFLSVGSIIYQICYGMDKNCRIDEGYLYLIKNTKILQEFAGGNLIDLLPWLRFVMPQKAKQFVNILSRFVKSVEKGVNDHKRTFDESHIRDLTDGFINAANKYTTDSSSNFGITEADIFSTLQDFLGGGFDTTSTTIEWILLYVGHYKHVQRKIQMEIDDVIGTRMPTLQDMGTLPYTEATILEVMRISPVALITIPHATTRVTKFRNFKIKQNTVVLCNVYATSMDSNTWKQPDQFLPDRFLDDNNKIIPENVDALLTFSTGRRRCPGELLARMELFLFVVNIFQKCSVELALKPDFTGIFGLNYKPKPYLISVNPRH